MLENEILVNVNEAAKLFGVTPATIGAMINSGRLPAAKLGPKCIRIKMSDLDKLFKSQAV